MPSPERKTLRRPLPVFVALLPLLAVSCTARQATTTTPPDVLAAPAEPPPPAPPVYDDLYRRLALGTARYEQGVELLVAGEEVLGEADIAAATRELMTAAEECSKAPGCDVGRFFETFDRLLAEQGIALKQQVVRVEELEASAMADVEREPGTTPFTASIHQRGGTASSLRGADLTDIISLNGPVKAAIDDWLTWMRPMLMEAYVNYRFLRTKMAPVYEEAGLPEALLFAMVATETGGKVHSYSQAGAAGLLQFMRLTGRRYGLKVVDGFDLRLDPEAATRANVAYLNEQFESLNNSLELALAAYNGGENRVATLHRRYGDNLWDSRIYYSLPRETREYVPRILAAAWLFLHPEDYNLEFPELNYETTMLELRDDIAIDELSICLGQVENPGGWFRTLRNLNPKLQPGDRVPAGEQIEFPQLLVEHYEERCLEGEHLVRARELHEANYPDEPEMIEYTVRHGDTLGRIASRFQCTSIGEIADINQVRAPRYTIHVGQTLKIPPCN